MKSKAFYRDYVKEQREKLAEYDKKKNDSIIYSKLVKSDEYKRANCIFIYVSYKNEVETHNIITTALEDGKIVCVPKIISLKEGMKAVKILGFNDLKVSKYGILEPALFVDNIIKPEQIDLVYLPGVAFDLKGGRIGYGGGFYDRFLSDLSKNTPRVALAYSFQIFDQVPMDEFDERIDEVIIE